MIYPKLTCPRAKDCDLTEASSTQRLPLTARYNINHRVFTNKYAEYE